MKYNLQNEGELGEDTSGESIRLGGPRARRKGKGSEEEGKRIAKRVGGGGRSKSQIVIGSRTQENM